MVWREDSHDPDTHQCHDTGTDRCTGGETETSNGNETRDHDDASDEQHGTSSRLFDNKGRGKDHANQENAIDRQSRTWSEPASGTDVNQALDYLLDDDCPEERVGQACLFEEN